MEKTAQLSCYYHCDLVGFLRSTIHSGHGQSAECSPALSLSGLSYKTQEPRFPPPSACRQVEWCVVAEDNVDNNRHEHLQ